MYRKIAAAGVLALGTSLALAAPAAAAPPVATSSIIINEVATHSGASATNEFVEIRRVSRGGVQSLNGWTLRIYDAAGAQTLSFSLGGLTLKSFGSTGQYALIGGTGYVGAVLPDRSLPAGTDVADLGAVALYNASGVFVDGVAFSPGSMIDRVTGEAVHTPSLAPAAVGRSINRNEASADVDNNSLDFAELHASQRNNSSIPRS